MSNDPPEKPKLIIDEDWKSQAQAEKEALRQMQDEKSDDDADSPSPEAEPAQADVSAPSQEAARGPLPPPTLTTLLSSLATQALMGLGQFPNPVTGQPELDPDQARHTIDSLQMLEEKTGGNRTDEESAILTRMLHELRIVFVQATSQSGAAGEAKD